MKGFSLLLPFLTSYVFLRFFQDLVLSCRIVKQGQAKTRKSLGRVYISAAITEDWRVHHNKLRSTHDMFHGRYVWRSTNQVLLL